MFREMRRGKQSLSWEDCIAILERGTSGTLALSGDGGYPYAVPLSYVYTEGRIVFHSAKRGHKIDAVQKEERASFCVIDQDQIVPERYTSDYRSVIVFGKIRIVEEEQEKRRLIEKLALKYAPGDDALNRGETIDKSWSSLCMLEMTIEHMTGKEGAGLAGSGKGNVV